MMPTSERERPLPPQDLPLAQEPPLFQPVLRLAALLIGATGLIALAGWLLGLPLLSSLGSGRIPVAPSTALLFVLYAVALFLRAGPAGLGAYRIVFGINTAGALVALLLLILSSQGLYLEAEHLGVAIVHRAGETPIGHMAPLTAFCFLLASLSSLASLTPSPLGLWRAIAAGLAAALLATTGFVLVLAYLYGAPLLYGGAYIPPAALTSMAFMVLGTALLALAVPTAWPMGGQYAELPPRALYGYGLVFLLVGGGIVATGYLVYRGHEHHYRTEVERQLSAIAELKVHELVQYRRERLGNAVILLDNAPFTGLVRRYLARPEDAENRAHLQAWLQRIEAHYQYDQVRLLDPDGVTRLSMPANLAPVSAVIAQRLPEVFAAGRVTIQDFYRNDYNGKIYLAVLLPILDPAAGNRPLGCLALRIDPEQYLYPFIRRWATPSRTAETLLVRREGNEVVFLNELRFQQHTALTLRFPLSRPKLPAAQAALGRQGIMEGIDYRGARVVADLRAIPDSPWFLVSRMDRTEAYAPMRQQLWIMGGFVAVLLFGLGATMAFAWQRQRVAFLRQQLTSAAALTKIETRYQRLHESISDAIAETTMTGEIVDANRAFQDMLGYSEEEIRHLRYQDITPPRWHALEEELLANQVLPRGYSEVYEKEYVRKDGSILPVELRAYLLRDDQGQPSGMWAIVRDISARKEVEEKIRNLNRVYAVLSNINQTIVRVRDPHRMLREACRIAVADGGFLLAWVCLLHDSSGEITMAASAGPDDGYVAGLCAALANEPHGQGPTATALRTGQHAVANDLAHDPSLAPRRAEEARQRGYRSAAAFPLAAFGKTRGTISLYADKPGFFDADEVKLLDELALDISYALEFAEQEERRQRAEAALQESQQLFASVANTSPALIWMAGPDQGATWFNEPWLAFTGRTMAEEQGEGWSAGVHPDDLPHRRHTSAEAFVARQPFAVEYRLRHHDGEYRWLLDQGQPRYDAAGAFAGYIGSCLDITERRKLEQQYLQAQKMESIGTLAGGIAHDFNNILSAIIGYGSLALLDLAADAPQRLHIKAMLEGTERAAHLTKDLLLFSRKQTSDRRPIDLNEAIKGVQKFMARIIGEDILCETTLHDQPLPILADGHQLEQVLMNLATNARDAMPQGGTLSITTAEVLFDAAFITAHGYGRPGDYAVLTVADSGKGMDETTRERIFEPFFTTKEMGKGTGLGLAVVYGIIKQHDGHINVYSEPGQGTTFRLYLPLLAAAAPVADQSPEEETPVGGNETILVAEDDAVLRNLANTLLTQFGYTVLTAVDGEDAVRQFTDNQERIQLLLFDLIMPKMNGKEAYEAIRKMRPGIRVLFASGYAPDIIRQKAMLDKEAAIIFKPFPPVRLLHKVREVLDAGPAETATTA